MNRAYGQSAQKGVKRLVTKKPFRYAKVTLHICTCLNTAAAISTASHIGGGLCQAASPICKGPVNIYGRNYYRCLLINQYHRFCRVHAAMPTCPIHKTSRRIR